MYVGNVLELAWPPVVPRDIRISRRPHAQPTKVDYSNKDDDAVREKMAYIYSYGITMFKRGLIRPEPLMKIVEERVARRVGLDGPVLDQWLNVPAAM